MLYRWVKKLHIYSGLLSFMAFVVWGIAGVGATFLPNPAEREQPKPDVRLVDFEIDPNASDQEISDAMIVASGLPFIKPGRQARRNPQGLLQVRYFTPNGTRNMTLLEDEGQIRIEQVDSPLWGFFNTLHMQTARHHNPGIEVTLWGGYNQFSLWAVIFMMFSGVYMWLATRPAMGWAQWTFGLSTVATIALYFALR